MTTALALVADCGEAPKFYYVHAHFTAMETKAGLKSLARSGREAGLSTCNLDPYLKSWS